MKALSNNFKQPQVSIIVLTYNNYKITLSCLDAIKKYTKNFSTEIIIIDNHSKPQDFQLLKNGLKIFNNFRYQLIRLPKNMGFSKASNIGAKKALGKYLVFINNDVQVTEGWLKPLISFLNKNPNVAACQPKIRSFKQKNFFDYAGGAGGFLDMFGYPFTRGRVFDSIEKDVGQYNTNKEITWASGACLVINKQCFQQIKGFDEYFFAYNEEVDLCIRLRQKGYRIYCVPKSVVFHYGAYTSNKNLAQKIYLMHHNNLYLILKHYSLWPYFPIIFFRVCLDFAAIIYYLSQFRINFVFSVFRAYFKMILNLPKLMRYGVISWKGKSLLKDKSIFRGSVVINYFLLSLKNFNQLYKVANLSNEKYKTYADITFLK